SVSTTPGTSPAFRHWNNHASEREARVTLLEGRRVRHRFWQPGGGYDPNITSIEALRATVPLAATLGVSAQPQGEQAPVPCYAEHDNMGFSHRYRDEAGNKMRAPNCARSNGAARALSGNDSWCSGGKWDVGCPPVALAGCGASASGRRSSSRRRELW